MRLISVAGLAGLAMLAFSATPSAAFTVPSSPAAQPFYDAPQIERVWWDQWGRWHSNRGYGHGFRYRGEGYRDNNDEGQGYGRRYHRHCWRGYYGHVRCE